MGVCGSPSFPIPRVLPLTPDTDLFNNISLKLFRLKSFFLEELCKYVTGHYVAYIYLWLWLQSWMGSPKVFLQREPLMQFSGIAPWRSHMTPTIHIKYNSLCGSSIVPLMYLSTSFLYLSLYLADIYIFLQNWTWKPY